MISWIILLILFTLLFQSIGFVCVIVSIILYLAFSKFSKKDSIELFTEKSIDGNIIQKIDQYEVEMNQEVFDINKLDSYKDILYNGQENEKIDLIGMVIFNPTKEFISLIRIALNDENETVRILASNSLQKFENFFDDTIEKLIKEYKKTNDEKYLIDLIKTYDNYINSTLLDSFLHKKYINKIFTLFNEIKNIESKKILYSLYLKLAVKYNHDKDLETKLINFVQYNPSNENLFMICEYFFKQSNIKEIYKYLKKINPKTLKSQKFKNIYQFWMNNAA